MGRGGGKRRGRCIVGGVRGKGETAPVRGVGGGEAALGVGRRAAVAVGVGMKLGLGFFWHQGFN